MKSLGARWRVSSLLMGGVTVVLSAVLVMIASVTAADIREFSSVEPVAGSPAIQPKPAPAVQPRTNTAAANNTAAGARPSGGSGNTNSSAGASCKLNSFVSGTLVLLADGSSRAIEDLRVGDLVLATDPGSGVTRAEPVVATITGVGDKHLVTITVTDERGTTGSVVATGGHPFWVADAEAWTDAAELVPGDWLRTSAGTWVQITAVQHDHREQTVHNLTVGAAHTYYVYAGDVAVLNHNCGGGSAQPRDSLGRFTSGAGGESPAAAAGRSAHSSYANAVGDGYVFNRALPGSKLRPDAVNWAERIVRELKPDSAKSISSGWRQVNNYKDYLEQATGKTWTAIVDVYTR